MHKTLSCLGIALFLCSTGVGAEQKMVIHEWGTFTSLQNEAGEAIGGINTDDEPVPRFVHRLADLLLLPTEVPILYFQGAPSCHPDVTMRLETPVIYFHPPASQLNPESANIVVKFRGGWLTEYYPFAEAFAPGLKTPAATPDPRLDFFRLGPLRSSTESRLEWNSLKIGGRWPVTNTTEHVWLSPRAVKSALVRTTNGESEKFLFYRGVAHINAPLRISRDAGTGELVFRSQLGELPSDKPLPIRAIWLVDIQRDGKIAFRSLPPLALEPNTKLLTHTPPSFVRPEVQLAQSGKTEGIPPRGSGCRRPLRRRSRCAAQHVGAVLFQKRRPARLFYRAARLDGFLSVRSKSRRPLRSAASWSGALNWSPRSTEPCCRPLVATQETRSPTRPPG